MSICYSGLNGAPPSGSHSTNLDFEQSAITPSFDNSG